MAGGGAGGQAPAAAEAPQPLRGAEEAVAEAVAEVMAEVVQAEEEPVQLETAEHFVGNMLGVLEKRKDFAGVIAGMRRHEAHAHTQIAGCNVLHELARTRKAKAVNVGTLEGIERILEAMQQHHAIIELQDAACDVLHQIAFRSRDGPGSNSAKIVTANGIWRICVAMSLECVKEDAVFAPKRGPRTVSAWNELQWSALKVLHILVEREPDDFTDDVREMIMQRAKHAEEAPGALDWNKDLSKTLRKPFMPRVCRDRSI